jgi:hypothetical protein
MLNYQPSRLPRRSANGSVLASALIPGVLGYLLTFLKQNRLFNGASESSFRNEFYFYIFGAFLIRLFFFWVCTHLSWGCWCSGKVHRSNRLRVGWNHSEYESQLIQTESRAFCRAADP